MNALPTSIGSLREVAEDFFGLERKAFSTLLPNLAKIDPQLWKSQVSVAFDDLRGPLLKQMEGDTKSTEAAASAVQQPGAPEGKAPAETTIPNTPDYALNWECLLQRVLSRLPAVPLNGLENAATQAIAVLKAGKYVILLGPPGTGKTELARVLCECAVDCGIPDFTTATATADWSTFETIGGYMPSATEAGQLVFSENVFVESVRTGRWLIIDELNRADIDKAFGELFTLFSGNKVRLSYRVEAKPIVLLPPGSSVDETMEYPIFLMPDWRMIGTMNTFDKASLFQLSYAFMRRFAFVEIPVPAPAVYQQLIKQRASSELNKVNTQTFTDAATEYLVKIFASETGLHSLGTPVGPAIPLDILKYLRERNLADNSRQITTDVKRATLEALEMYLYPQFEGRNELHAGIVNTVAAALDLASNARTQTSRLLSNWTGVEEQNEAG